VIKIGLTGNFGCGKSTALKIFAQRGFAVLDADDLAREVVKPGQRAYRQIVKHFGQNILQPDSTIDRAKLARVVFFQTAQRKALDAMVHPPVRRKIRDFMNACQKSHKAMCVVCIPLLYETGMESWFDGVVAVKASRASILERARKSRGMRRSEALARLRAQMPLAEKCKRADFVLDNGGSKLHLRRQVKALLKEL